MHPYNVQSTILSDCYVCLFLYCIIQNRLIIIVLITRKIINKQQVAATSNLVYISFMVSAVCAC